MVPLIGLLLIPAVPARADDETLPGIAQTAKACASASAKNVQAVPWPQTFLHPEEAWPLAQGDGVTVAVLGSGVTDAAGILGGRLAGSSPHDCVGHGTFLAGLIAAAHRDGTGFAGIAPRARILAVGVTDDTGASSADQLATGIRTAADAGARVICVGVTVPTGSDALLTAVRYAVGKGSLVVAPAAADSTAGSAAQPPAAVYPAGYAEVLAVRDLGPGGVIPPNSAVPGRVDLAAPGDAVMGPGPSGAGYFTGSGPSFATALVAGAAALTLSYQPDLTVSQLIRRLKGTAYPTPVPTLDLVAAVTATLPEATPVSPLPARLTMPPAAPASPAPRQAAVIAGGALALVALVAVAAAVLPRGRRRGWRPRA